MDYVKPQDIAGSMVAAGASKVNLPIKHLLIRGALAGAYLAVATSMAVGAALQTGQPIVGALVFPFGLCLVILLGTELITGSFRCCPARPWPESREQTWAACCKTGAGCF